MTEVSDFPLKLGEIMNKTLMAGTPSGPKWEWAWLDEPKKSLTSEQFKELMYGEPETRTDKDQVHKTEIPLLISPSTHKMVSSPGIVRLHRIELMSEQGTHGLEIHGIEEHGVVAYKVPRTPDRRWDAVFSASRVGRIRIKVSALDPSYASVVILKLLWEPI